ncbi:MULTISPECIES: hypothetical protein [Actinomadura]|uniref:DUF3040 domain-containing protein n=1 Tax=Actinomadura yumaensis TaxID=111807 RepID=A0ABW2CW58_9ACTN|nr:hypothetical protein [Actinomadura sp. J1-007]MWK39594.1 hypothetical protein [Actinomadura sp. J1-007]
MTHDAPEFIAQVEAGDHDAALTGWERDLRTGRRARAVLALALALAVVAVAAYLCRAPAARDDEEDGPVARYRPDPRRDPW